MQILLIQSRGTSESANREQSHFIRAVGDAHSLCSVSTLDTSLNWANPEALLKGNDAVIFGGSADFDLDGGRTETDPARATSRSILTRIESLVQHLIDTDTPTLGVCYGHQLIAEIYGGRVTHDCEQMKIGSHDVSIVSADDRLFGALPGRFTAQYGHRDSVTVLPRGATLVAQGDQCAYSALRYGERIYTTQFHPELTADDIRVRISSMSGYLPGRIATKDDVRESHEASRIISDFISLASCSTE